MSFSKFLTADQKKAIIEQRIVEWAAEHYKQDVIRDAMLAANPDANTTVPDELQAELSTAITNAQEKLAAIEAESVTAE
jgi:hypothetical protein